jgi:hypothetical protein
MPRVTSHTPAASTGKTEPKTLPAKKTEPKPVEPKKVPTDNYEPKTGQDAGPRAQITSKGIGFAGKTGAAALTDLANYIEAGGAPFAHLSDAEQKTALSALTRALSGGADGKQTRAGLLERSAAVTALLSLAGAAKADVRDQALASYTGAMKSERTFGLRMSMMVNLDAAKLPLTGKAATVADQVRGELLPQQPPYDKWFKGDKHTLNVRHYVMEDFYKANRAAYLKRGFTIKSETPNRIEFTKELVDPTGKNRTVTANVTAVKGDSNIFRDMKNPDVQMVVYSGHAQLGGVVEGSLAAAKGKMAGDKLVQLYQCRGKQTVGDVLARYPGAQATATFSSSYDEDDVKVLTDTFDLIARRGSYPELRTDLRGEGLLQTSRNYLLPDDARMLATRDEDRDGRRDLSGVGADKFFDPRRAKNDGGEVSFKPSAVAPDPESVSGEKLAHAVSYANTAFFYFAEENKAAPLTVAQSDHFVPAGWFASKGDEAVRVTERQRDGQTYYEVAVNSRYAGQSREAIAAMTLFEMQKYLCQKTTGTFSEPDKLRGLQLVQGYTDMMVEYREDCDKLMKNFGSKYGFKGVNWDVVAGASVKDGDDKMGSAEALDYLRKNGVVAPR